MFMIMVLPRKSDNQPNHDLIPSVGTWRQMSLELAPGDPSTVLFYIFPFATPSLSISPSASSIRISAKSFMVMDLQFILLLHFSIFSIVKEPHALALTDGLGRIAGVILMVPLAFYYVGFWGLISLYRTSMDLFGGFALW